MQEGHEIFVRAHAPIPKKEKWRRRCPKWPNFALIFDTETTVDTTQKLTFGCFRRCELVGDAYQCIEEGLFHADALSKVGLRVLERYPNSPLNVPETKTFPPQQKLKLVSRSKFISHVFWRAVRGGDLVVGFNLPFDLSRLAVKSSNGNKGSWSLVLSNQKSRKTGETELNRNRPRISITSLNSKLAFIKLRSNMHRKEWPNECRFLDLRTFTFALRDESYNLERACKAFGVKGKLKHKLTGKVTPTEIKYCRRDVAATNRLLNAAKKEFDQHPTTLDPDEAYSPASIAKSYLEKMNIVCPKKQFEVSNRVQGIAMQGYYGGRAECRIRKTSVPVVLTDFTSQYPTVNALLGNWNVLRASQVHFETCTEKVRRLFSNLTLDKMFDPKFWKELSFFALVEPNEDILPVRTVYNGRTQNIGLNYLRSEKPIWYGGPDLIASALLTGNAPRVARAIRMVAKGQQRNLFSTNLGGLVPIDPRKDDFFIRVIEQKSHYKHKNEALAKFLKVLGNSGSYGLFVEVNPETRSKAVPVGAYFGEKFERVHTKYVEKPGHWYFPPLASLITAGGRLLLAMLERCVRNLRGSYLFCDTDSMCIVASSKGGRVPCVGGQFDFQGKDAIKVLSLSQVKAIASKFNRLNPYNTSPRLDLLKIEDVNFHDSDPNKSPRQLFGYAIAAKRYALYTRTDAEIEIVKASGHGLGYLFAPKENEDGESHQETPDWVFEAWDWLLRKELGVKPCDPKWLGHPAMMRMAVTSPNVMRTNRPDWLSPFNFFLFPLLSDIGGYPAGFDKSNFKFIVPFESNRARLKTAWGVNLWDENAYQIKMVPDGKQRNVVPDSMRIILSQYLRHPEAKSLAFDGTECRWNTQGLLQRASIVASGLVPIGKETDRRWDHGEDPSLIDFELHQYRKTRNLVISTPADREKLAKYGIRAASRKTNLSQKTIYAILEGRPVRNQKLAEFQRAMGS